MGAQACPPRWLKQLMRVFPFAHLTSCCLVDLPGRRCLQVDREAGELVADFYTNIINEKGGLGGAAAAGRSAAMPAPLPSPHPRPASIPAFASPPTPTPHPPRPWLQAWPATP